MTQSQLLTRTMPDMPWVYVTNEFLLQVEAYLRENGFDPSTYS